MENKINIAEILKDCPKGTKLYSPLFGEVTLEEVNTECTALITIKYNANICSKFFKTGLYYNYEGAECLLFPSSEMRDWSKFFKRGDVAIQLFNGCGVLVEEWTDDSYTSFKASVFQLKKGGFAKRDKRVFSTDDFVKASDEQRDKFIADMEKYFGGKYNPETLQVEPVKLECPFKPFDKVLVRNYKDAKWNVNFFSYYEDGAEYKYHCLISSYRYCIHYEGNEHFLNTTKPYTEGGSE